MLINEEKIWIIVASSYDARIFSTAKLADNWELIKEFINPEARLKDQDLVTDKYGNYRNNIMGKPTSAYSEYIDPKIVDIDRFAATLADEINLARTQNKFHKLIMVAPPKFSGMLNKHCDKLTLELVVEHLEKDYTKLAPHELFPMVRKQIKPFNNS